MRPGDMLGAAGRSRGQGVAQPRHGTQMQLSRGAEEMGMCARSTSGRDCLGQLPGRLSGANAWGDCLGRMPGATAWGDCLGRLT